MIKSIFPCSCLRNFTNYFHWILMKSQIKNGFIYHTGVVQKVDDKLITVKISPVSSCSGCQNKESCSLTGSTEKLIVIQGRYNLACGDTVNLYLKQADAFKALFIGYILPLLVILFTIFFCIAVRISELACGISAIILLAGYYTILFVSRSTLDKKFTVQINT